MPNKRKPIVYTNVKGIKSVRANGTDIKLNIPKAPIKPLTKSEMTEREINLSKEAYTLQLGKQIYRKSEIINPWVRTGGFDLVSAGGLFTPAAPLSIHSFNYTNPYYDLILDELYMSFNYNREVPQVTEINWSDVGIRYTKINQSVAEFLIPQSRNAPLPPNLDDQISSYLHVQDSPIQVLHTPIRIKFGDSIFQNSFNISGFDVSVLLLFMGHYEIAEGK